MDPVEARVEPPPRQDLPRKVFPTKTRKRARKACLLCRSRKVRCDVSQRGRPCANCYLDEEPCVVTGRTSQYRRAQYDIRDGIQASLPPYVLPEQRPNATAAALDPETAEQEDPSFCERSGLISHEPEETRPSENHRSIHDIPPEVPFEGSQRQLLRSPGLPPGPADSSEDKSSVDDPSAFLLGLNSTPTSFHNQWGTLANGPASSEIVYCCYPFLRISNIHQIPQNDASFLENQGCLRVPIRPFLDDLVQHYFLHIHPFLPLINEGDFWELYYDNSCDPPKSPMSLLLFQAMLFAACTFISESTIAALGYADIRTMRATFLRRTKLLYDLECESSPLVIAQASILLSSTSLSASKRPNTTWLSLAIENAKLAEAHLYATKSSIFGSKHQNVLKRLWWSCIIRDRSMSLLMRRQIHITKEQFDFTNDPLTSTDLVDEFQRSKVYNFSTKEKLADILSQSITLCITLTDILLLIFPPNGLQGPMQNEHDKSIYKLQECKASLRRWYALAAIKMPQRSSCTGPSTTPQTDQAIGEASIILYANLVYMYYHTARIVICHYEVLHLDILWGGTNGSYSLTEDLSTIFKTRRELQDATSDIAECHKEILLLGLARFLPNSAIGFIVLPLVLNILDVKLCPPTADGMHQTSATTQHQLNVLIQLVRAYWTRYDGIDWVTEIVRHIIGLAQLDESRLERKFSTINWADIFAFQPRSYLRLVLAVDLSLSTGRLPQDGDFPVKLRGLFSMGANPLRELIEGHHPNAVEDHNSARAPSLQGDPHIPTKSSFDGRLHQTILGLDECLVTILESGINFLQPEQVANTNITRSRGEEAGNGGISGDHSSPSSLDDSDDSPASSGKVTDKERDGGSQHWADSECQDISGLETGNMSGGDMDNSLFEAILEASVSSDRGTGI